MVPHLINAIDHRDEDRKYHEIDNKDQIMKLVDKYLDKSSVRLLQFPKDINANVELLRSGKCIHLSLNKLLPPGYEIGSVITVYAIKNHYIELFLSKGFFDGKDGVFDLVKARIASNTRKYPRINVENKEFTIENFRLSKEYIGPHLKETPKVIKDAYQMIQFKMSKEFPRVTFITLNENKSRDLLAVETFGKPLMLEDLRKGLTKAPNSDFLNYKDYLGDQFEHELDILKTERIRSLLVIPVIYNNIIGEKTLLGFFKLVSSGDAIRLSEATRIYHYIETMISQVHEDYNLKFNISQKVINISKLGVQAVIDNEGLARAMDHNPEELAFDVKVGTQFRYSFTGKIMNISSDKAFLYKAGIRIIGQGEKNLGISEWSKKVEEHFKLKSMQNTFEIV